MKMVQVAGLFAVTMIYTSVQAMQLPEKRHLEKQLWLNRVMVMGYLQEFERVELEEESRHGKMLKDIRTAKYENPRNSIYEFLAGTKISCLLWELKNGQYVTAEQGCKELHRSTKNFIVEGYLMLEKYTQEGLARPTENVFG